MIKTFTRCIPAELLLIWIVMALFMPGLASTSFAQHRGVSSMQLDSIRTNKLERQGVIRQELQQNDMQSGEFSVSRPGKSQYFVPDKSTGWSHAENRTYSYNAEGKLLKRISLDPVTNDTLSRVTYAYDNHGNIAEYLNEKKRNGSWMIGEGDRYNTSYNAQGKITEMTYSWYFNGDWALIWKDNFTYDGQGNLLEYKWYDWMEEKWALYQHVIRTYPNPEQPATTVDTIYYVDNEVEFRSKDTLIVYDDENRILSHLTLIHNDSAWATSARTNYQYDANGGSVKTIETYTGDIWEPSYRYTSRYDDHKSFVEYKKEKYVNGEWILVHQNQYEHSYSSSGDITETITRSWNNNVKVLKDISKENFSDFQYFTVASASHKIAILEVKVYPNPTAFAISIQSETAESTELIINDLAGRTVFRQTLSASFGAPQQVDISTLPTGIYMLNMKNRKGAWTSKIVKQ
jgi:hypothetical protein